MTKEELFKDWHTAQQVVAALEAIKPHVLAMKSTPDGRLSRKTWLMIVHDVLTHELKQPAASKAPDTEEEFVLPQGCTGTHTCWCEACRAADEEDRRTNPVARELYGDPDVGKGEPG